MKFRTFQLERPLPDIVILWFYSVVRCRILILSSFLGQNNRREAYINLDRALRRINWNQYAAELKLWVEGRVGESDMTPQGNFFEMFLLDQGPFCGATDCPCFGLCVTLPMGFKSRVVLSPAHVLACIQ